VSTADNIHYAVSCDLKSSCSYAVDETKIPSGKNVLYFNLEVMVFRLCIKIDA